MKPVLTAVQGANAKLIEQVAKLYFPPKAKVADVTYGNGAFWEWEVSRDFSLTASDLYSKSASLPCYDCRSLPYAREQFDVVVFDPPYMHGGKTAKASIGKCYGNAPTALKDHKAIACLYYEGMKEAYRILKPGGILLVKCQDEIESGKQKRTHIEVFQFAYCLQFKDLDLFVLMQNGTPCIRQREQKHARKNHSFLWVFRK